MTSAQGIPCSQVLDISRDRNSTDAIESGGKWYTAKWKRRKSTEKSQCENSWITESCARGLKRTQDYMDFVCVLSKHDAEKKKLHRSICASSLLNLKGKERGRRRCNSGNPAILSAFANFREAKCFSSSSLLANSTFRKLFPPFSIWMACNIPTEIAHTNNNAGRMLGIQ